MKCKSDLSGKVTIGQSQSNGTIQGNLTFETREKKIFRFPRCWEGQLVSITGIRWPNGENWVIFVWDHGQNSNLRTISLFDPRVQNLFSLELGFKENDQGATSNIIHYRISWNLSLPQNKKYLDFLENLKLFYAAGKIQKSEISTRRIHDSFNLASFTFQFSKKYTFEKINNSEDD